MNLDIDRNFIWVIAFAFVVIALTNKGGFPFSFLTPPSVNNECGQEEEPCYIYKSKKSNREHRVL